MTIQSRPWFSASAVALIAFLSGFIVLAPATLFDRILSSYSDGKVRLSKTNGTLWAGEGYLELRNSQNHSIVTQAISWRFSPRSLLHGQAAYAINLNQAGHIPLAVSLWTLRVDLADAQLALPMAALGMAVPKLTPLRLTGDFRIRIPKLSIERDKFRGHVLMQWKNAASGLSPVSPLGEYEVRFDGEESRAQLTLLTIQGPLQLNGKSDWIPGKKPIIAISARVSPNELQKLAPVLRLIAVEHEDGSFELRVN